MDKHKVAVFRPYLFEVGQKIHIEGGPRKGDWEVIGVAERKIRLRCPITSRVVEWDRFCYFVQELDDVQWPQE
ncbi:MAG: hypothetical protein JRI80_03655 [Deltaproteobacteria bacterium]|nr:hypothetical protein [Deltaproteobacteria bacterium]